MGWSLVKLVRNFKYELNNRRYLLLAV